MNFQKGYTKEIVEMRLDSYLCYKGYFVSRTKSKQAIESGKVFIDGVLQIKPSFEINEKDGNVVEIKRETEFVSLGGYKLEKALADFSFSVDGLIVADLGASTGGFTDCLLQHGAKKVYSVDLNDSLLDERLKKDERVSLIIKNVRQLSRSDFPEKIEVVTADLSFISLTKVLPIISDIIDDGAYVIALIKPQFETETRMRFKNGIIKDERVKTAALKRVYEHAISAGFSPRKITCAPIVKDKNEEFLILLKKAENETVAFDKVFV